MALQKLIKINLLNESMLEFEMLRTIQVDKQEGKKVTDYLIIMSYHSVLNRTQCKKKEKRKAQIPPLFSDKIKKISRLKSSS